MQCRELKGVQFGGIQMKWESCYLLLPRLSRLCGVERFACVVMFCKCVLYFSFAVTSVVCAQQGKVVIALANSCIFLVCQQVGDSRTGVRNLWLLSEMWLFR